MDIETAKKITEGMGIVKSKIWINQNEKPISEVEFRKEHINRVLDLEEEIEMIKMEMLEEEEDYEKKTPIDILAYVLKEKSKEYLKNEVGLSTKDLKDFGEDEYLMLATGYLANQMKKMGDGCVMFENLPEFAIECLQPSKLKPILINLITMSYSNELGIEFLQEHDLIYTAMAGKNVSEFIEILVGNPIYLNQFKKVVTYITMHEKEIGVGGKMFDNARSLEQIAVMISEGNDIGYRTEERG